MKKSKSESGAVLYEYVIAISLLLAVFAIVALLLQSAGEARRDSAMNIHKETIPCDAKLSGDDCL